MCLDEIHKVPDWSSILKSVHETLGESVVVASGSSLLRLRSGSEDLSRRALFHRMPGLSFREYVELRWGVELPVPAFSEIIERHEELVLPILDTVSGKGLRIPGLFGDYLRHGYYPYFTEYPEVEMFRQALEQDTHVTVEPDLLSVHPQLTAATARRLRFLLFAISVSVPFTPDLKKLRQAADITDSRTPKSYLSYLEEGGLIRMLGSGGGTIGRLRKPEKIYLDNTNQQFALTAGRQVNMGTLREAFFASMAASSGVSVHAPAQGDFGLDQIGRAHV